MHMRHKIGVAFREDLAPDILMKAAHHVAWSDVVEGDFIASGAFGIYLSSIDLNLSISTSIS